MRRTALRTILLQSFAARRFKSSPFQHSPQRWADFAGSSIAIYVHPAQQISLPDHEMLPAVGWQHPIGF